MEQWNVERITELAEALTPISDMAVLMDVSEMELRRELDDRSTPASRTYRRAKARTALEIRRRDIEQAAAGSPAAAENMVSYFNRMTDDE